MCWCKARIHFNISTCRNALESWSIRMPQFERKWSIFIQRKHKSNIQYWQNIFLYLKWYQITFNKKGNDGYYSKSSKILKNPVQIQVPTNLSVRYLNNGIDVVKSLQADLRTANDLHWFFWRILTIPFYTIISLIQLIMHRCLLQYW